MITQGFTIVRTVKYPLKIELGQVGNYMIELELKYGFLTNYDYTFFLRRELIDGKETMFCSDPIKYDASHGNGDVSIRESLLFLQMQVQGDESSWYMENPNQESVIRQQKNEPISEVEGKLRDVTTQLDNQGGRQTQQPENEADASSGGDSGLHVEQGGNDGPRRSARLNAHFNRNPVTISKSSSHKRKRK